MERCGKLDGVITQNIDGLHQKAGSQNVQEIHGSAMRSYCVSCKKEYGPDFIFESQDEIPKCPACGKMVRPDVTLYGEMLPEAEFLTDETKVAAIEKLEAIDKNVLWPDDWSRYDSADLEIASAADGGTLWEAKKDIKRFDRSICLRRYLQCGNE